MGYYVLMLKEHETEDEVIYRFGPDQEHMGRIKLLKSEGVIEQLEPVPGYSGEALFMRAGTKLAQHWKKGVYPNETCWAS